MLQIIRDIAIYYSINKLIDSEWQVKSLSLVNDV